MRLTKLSVKHTRLVSTHIKVHIFLVDLFIPVDTIYKWVIPHRMVPPIKDWKLYGVIHRIAIAAPHMLFDGPSRDVIHFPVPFQRIEGQQEAGFLIKNFIDSGAFLGFRR